MLTTPEHVLERRAELLVELTGGVIVPGTGRVGGGALPLLELPGPVVAVEGRGDRSVQAVAQALRAGEPAVLARVQQDRLLLDPRTLTDEEARQVGHAVQAALS